MKRRRCKRGAAALLVVVVLLLSRSWASSLSIIALDLPGLHHADGSGVYDQIIQEAFAFLPQKPERQLFPPSRADKQFERCTNCCISPMNTNPEFYLSGPDVVQTEAMNVAKVYGFSSPGTGIYSDIESLKNKSVGVIKGLPYGKSVDAAKLNLVAVRDLPKLLTLLEKRRIDVFLAFVPDVYVMFNEMNMTPLPHDPEKPIVVHPDALVCRGVEAAVIQGFNANIRRMKTSGRMRDILGDSYIPE